MSSSHSGHTPRPALPSAEEIARLPPDGGPNFNRLVFEKSPYLLQHAANPVDWYPWGEEAFRVAREQQKPVFLSIGYSTCHWCHVMEHESFEDPEVARLMNEVFVCIKVDREERPDIDHVYMTVTQAMTGSGGWPMTVLLTPDKKPFFAGTYFPKESRYGRPGMRDLIGHFRAKWKDDRAKIQEASSHIASELAKIAGGAPGEALTEETLALAFEMFDDRFDEREGGFGHRPKFPVPHNLMFLLRHHRRTGEAKALKMVEKTLQRMRFGGIFDQVGYGFHRYSTDEHWLVPHFEKMLYDQALMAMAATEAYQATGDAQYRRTAEQVFTYVLRDMQSPEGGFYSAEDADSEGEEGKFYVWSVEEVLRVLGEQEGKLFAKAHNFEADGNFREESTGQRMGTNIPFTTRAYEELPGHMNEPEPPFLSRIEAARQRLFAEREKRIHPLKDDKVLTDWNGLMIAALAKGARAFGSDTYRTAARRAAEDVLTRLRRPDGRLLKRARGAEAGLPAHLEDYAFLAWGTLELYEATLDPRTLATTRELVETLLAHFWDDAGKGFFQTADDGEELLVRSKECYDGALPSGNSVAALVLLRLGRMTGNIGYEDRALETLSAFSGMTSKNPANFSVTLMAVDFALGGTQEVVLAGDPADPAFQALRAEVDRAFLPNTVLLHRPTQHAAAVLALAPMVEGNTPVGGRATAYVCRNFACESPVFTPEDLRARLAAGRGK